MVFAVWVALLPYPTELKQIPAIRLKNPTLYGVAANRCYVVPSNHNNMEAGRGMQKKKNVVSKEKQKILPLVNINR